MLPLYPKFCLDKSQFKIRGPQFAGWSVVATTQYYKQLENRDRFLPFCPKGFSFKINPQKRVAQSPAGWRAHVFGEEEQQRIE